MTYCFIIVAIGTMGTEVSCSNIGRGIETFLFQSNSQSYKRFKLVRHNKMSQ